MLGHVVVRLLESVGCSVHTTERRYDGTPSAPLLEALLASGCQFVVNCARAHDQQCSSQDLFMVNGLLPLHLAATIAPDVLLIHASSDGVFTANLGSRSTDERPDATDGYGLSKRLGEGCMSGGAAIVLRTSIVGPELGSPRSLFGRVLTAEGPVVGYVDHRWNGITTLEWARLAYAAILRELPVGLHHPACETPVSKYNLVTSILRVHGCATPVRPMTSGNPVVRTLVPTLSLASIEEQLLDMRNWYEEENL